MMKTLGEVSVIRQIAQSVVINNMLKYQLYTTILASTVFMCNSAYGLHEIGGSITTDGRVNTGPIELKAVEDVDYLDGDSMLAASPGMISGFPQNMSVYFGANFIVSKGNTHLLYRVAPAQYKDRSMSNDEVQKWSRYYERLAEAIGNSWRSKDEGNSLVIVRIGRDSRVSIIKILESPKRSTQQFQSNISFILSSTLAKHKSSFPNSTADTIQFAARFQSYNEEETWKTAEAVYPSIRAASLLKSSLAFNDCGYKDVAKVIFEQAKAILNAEPGKGRSLQDARSEMKSCLNKLESVENVRCKPVADDFWHKEFLKRSSDLIRLRHYETLADLGSFGTDSFSTRDPHQLANNMYTALIASYSGEENSFEEICAFCERAVKECQNEDDSFRATYEALLQGIIHSSKDLRIQASARIHLAQLNLIPKPQRKTNTGNTRTHMHLSF